MVKLFDHIEIGFVEVITNMFNFSFFYIEVFRYKKFVKSPSKFWGLSVVLSIWYIGDCVPILVLLSLDVN